MFQSIIGRRSKKVKNQVERGAVKRFAEAIGDPHPIYSNEDVGLHPKYHANIAPPTFPQVFDYGEIEGVDIKMTGLIHGEQKFHYERPLLVGEEVYCNSVVKKYTEKRSGKGFIGILLLENQGDDAAGNQIFSSEMTIIITEDARRMMNIENA